ncbi:unnamed protein product [Hymenolepis diminuta]|uniref:Uncharacterized protein n=1 Tax=Hymenolepis diminuta TaxID=6216 RepID=A0A564Z9M2_HYMDI|nr:unnamed protein product [Hymenolepis diminuta]
MAILWALTPLVNARLEFSEKLHLVNTSNSTECGLPVRSIELEGDRKISWWESMSHSLLSIWWPSTSFLSFSFLTEINTIISTS